MTLRAGTRSLGRMSALTLVIGSRNYSSWSLRPWLLLRHLGLPFEERQFHLDTPEFDAEIAKISPTRRVPVLVHGELVVWESLAICEYASELAGGRGWPGDPRLRALARAAAAEMHSGFGALRAACPMNARATGRQVPMTPPLARDLARIDAIWSGCRRDHGRARTLAVRRVQRRRRDVRAGGVARAQLRPAALLASLRATSTRCWATSHLRDWIDASCRETQVIPHEEVGAGA